MILIPLLLQGYYPIRNTFHTTQGQPKGFISICSPLYLISNWKTKVGYIATPLGVYYYYNKQGGNKMTISSQIKQLTDAYKEMSIICMKDLCEVAGVQYRHPNEAKELLEELHTKGYSMRVQKFTEEEHGVGQFLFLTDLEDGIVKGHKIWIDYDGYQVRKETVNKLEHVNRTTLN